MGKVAAVAEQIVAVSPLYATACMPAGSGPDFVNAAMAIRTWLTPAELLQQLHNIEIEFDRNRHARWAPRTMDLDLLAFGDLVLPNSRVWAEWAGLNDAEKISHTPDQLILPHPRLQERGFVLIPLADIAPDWVHPCLGQDVGAMIAALTAEDRAGVSLIHGSESLAISGCQD